MTIVWTEYSLPIFGMCLAASPTRIVCGGVGIASSDDGGVTWTEDTTAPPGTWYAGVHDGTGFVFVGLDGVCITSATGAAGSWASVALPELETCYSIAAYAGTIIATNNIGSALLSTDHGANWSVVDIVPDDGVPWVTIMHDGTNWVAVTNFRDYMGSHMQSATSAAGTAWTVYEMPMIGDGAYGPAPVSLGADLVFAEYSEEGSDPLLAGATISADHGAAWGTLNSMPAMEIYGMVSTGIALFAVGGSDYRVEPVTGLCSSSSDGETWTPEDGFSTPMLALIEVGSTLLAVGDHVVAVGLLVSPTPPLNPPVTFDGLDHLNGKEVYLLVDGNVMGPYMVSGGICDPSADFPLTDIAAYDAGTTYAEGEYVTYGGYMWRSLVAGNVGNTPADGAYWTYVHVHIGLRYDCDLETLDLPPGEGKTRVKVIKELAIEFEASRGLWYGEDFDHLNEWNQRQVEDSYETIGAFTGQARFNIRATWNHGGRAVIRQVDPLPVTILAVTREVEYGG